MKPQSLDAAAPEIPDQSAMRVRARQVSCSCPGCTRWQIRCWVDLQRRFRVSALALANVVAMAVLPANAAMRAHEFLSTLGVNTHLEYTDGAYANTQEVVADLSYLGIHLIRDGIPNPGGGTPYRNYLSALDTVTAAGNRIAFIAGPGLSIAISLLQVGNIATAHPGSVVAIEGSNEINNFAVSYHGISDEAAARAFQRDLYASVKTDATLAGVPIYYFTGGKPFDLAANPGLADYANAHPYPYRGQQPARRLAQEFASNFTMVGRYAKVITETGYYDEPRNPYGSGVDNITAAKLTLNLLLDAASQGVSRTFLYQLRSAYPDPGDTNTDVEYGLFRKDNSPKPMAVAIHNLTTILADPGSDAATFARRPFTYTLHGLPANASELLLSKSNGRHALIVWAEPDIWSEQEHATITTASHTVTLRFAASIPSVALFDPMSGISAIDSWTNVDSIQFILSDHPMIVDVSPGD